LKVINNPLFILYFYRIKNFIPSKVPTFITLFSLDFFLLSFFAAAGVEPCSPSTPWGFVGVGFFMRRRSGA
ncbi:TPA: hypothetical protein ACXH44_001504, partial [Neisseria meningitidis]